MRDIREFMAKPAPMRHLYEIHTSPQPPLKSVTLIAMVMTVSNMAILSALLVGMLKTGTNQSQT